MQAVPRFLFALLLLGSASAFADPWGWAEGPSGRTPLTGSTVPSDATNVAFAAGEVAFDGIAVANRKLSFTANPAGTTLAVGGARSGFGLSGASGDWTFRGISFVGTGDCADTVYDGGAICCSGGRLTIENCTFDNVNSRFTGGAVSAYLMDGDVSVSKCMFTRNASGPMNGMGGALYCSRGPSGIGTLRLDGCTFRGNIAQNGGAVATVRVIDDFESPMPVEMSGCAFRGNTADYSGGAVDDEGDLSVTNTLFADNGAALQGGAICAGTSDPDWAGADLTVLAGTEFRGNLATNSVDDSRYWTCGGAVAVAEAGFALSVSGRHVVFVGNRAESASSSYGGAIAAVEGTVVDVSCAAFLANRASSGGGAVCSWGDKLGISTSIFSNNTVTVANGYGGAVSAESGAALTMRNSTVRGSNGGAIDVYRASAQVVNCVVVDNGAADLAFTESSASFVSSTCGTLVNVDGSGIAVPLSDCSCSLTNRTATIYAGDALRLRPTGFNEVAALGLRQDALDYDGVAYGSRPVGYSMGAYETPAGGLVATVRGSRRYDGTTSGPTNLVWSLVDSDGRPVGLPGLGGLTNLYAVTGWEFVSCNVGVYSSTNALPSKRLDFSYSVKPGPYAFYADVVSLVAEGEILPRPVTFLSASAKKVYDSLPLTTNAVSWTKQDEDGFGTGVLTAEEGNLSFDVTGSRTEVGMSPNLFEVVWGEGIASSNYAATVEYGTLTVTARDAAGLMVDYPDPFVYGGTNICPQVTVTLTNALGQAVSNLVEGTDFSVAYYDNVNAYDDPYLVVTPGGNFAGGPLTNAFTILPRPVTFRSASAEKVYDSLPLTTNAVSWTRQDEDGFGTGVLTAEEGFLSFDVTGSRTEVGSSPNLFEVVWGEGIASSNYESTVEYGTLTVTARPDPRYEIVQVNWYHNRSDGLFYPRVLVRFIGGEASRLVGFTLTCEGTERELPESCIMAMRNAAAGDVFAFGVDPTTFVRYPNSPENWGFVPPEDRMLGAHDATRPVGFSPDVQGTPHVDPEKPGGVAAKVQAAASFPAERIVQGVKFSRTLTDVPGPKITASGLPNGLRIVATAVKEKVGRSMKTVGYTCVLSGTPTKAGAYRAKFKQKVGRETSVTEETFTVEALPTWAFGSFGGWSVSASGGVEDVGAASLTVTSAGRISGSMPVQGKKWTFSMAGFDMAPADENGAFEATVEAKNGRLRENVRIAISPDEFSNCSCADMIGESKIASLRRSIWKDKPAQWKIQKAKFNLDELGFPHVMVSVATSGKVTFSGKLPDGRSASGSSTAFVDESGAFHAYLIVPQKNGHPGFLLDIPLAELEVAQ